MTTAQRRAPVPDATWAYFLDFDGTLVALAGTPAEVEIGSAVTGALRALYRTTGGAVALITGRSIADIDRLFGVLRLPIAGQHGLERRTAAGRTYGPEHPAHALDEARLILARATAHHAGLLLEDKGHSLALHYRSAPALAGYAHRVAKSVIPALGTSWHAVGGKYVIEIRPKGTDKGTAINAFMKEDPFLGRTPVFLGDDRTDEYGFAMIRLLGGVAVKVGPGPTLAGWRLPDITAVRSWLTTHQPSLVPTR